MSELLGRRRILEPKNLIDGPIPSPPSWSLAIRREEATRNLETSRPPHQHSQGSGRKFEPVNTSGKQVELSKKSRIHFKRLKPESRGQAEVQIDGGSTLLPGLGPRTQRPGEILDVHENHSAPTPGPTPEDSVTATNGPEVEAVEGAVDQAGCIASQLVNGPTPARIRSLQGRQNREDAQQQLQASDDGPEKSLVPQPNDNSPTTPAYKPTEKRKLKYVWFRSFSIQKKPQSESQWKNEQRSQQQQHHNPKPALIEEVDGLIIMDDIDPPAADIQMFNRKIIVALRNALKSTKGSMDERSDRSSIEFLMTQDNGSIGREKPTIVIFCASSHRKAEIIHKISSSEQQKLLESFDFPVRVLHDQQLRYLSQPQPPNISTWRVYKKSASNDGISCAALIKMVSNAHVETEPSRSEATLGGLILLGDSLYGLTVAHPLLQTVASRSEAPLTSHATESESHATVLTSVASINDGSGKNTALEAQQASENELPVGRIYRYALSDEISSRGAKKGAEGHVTENSDWALVDFEDEQLLLDTFANELQINVQPWDSNRFDDTEYDDTFSRDVTIMSGVSGKVHGVLSMTKSVLSLEGSIFNVHRIVMDCMETLDRGDSGSWVINHDEILCGVIIAGRQSMNWAYMLPIADVFHSISNYFPDAVVRLATKRDLMRYRAAQSRKSPQTSKGRAASPNAIQAVGESSSRSKPPIPRSADRDTALTSDSISRITAESADLKENHNAPEFDERDNYKATTVTQRHTKWNAELNAVLSHISFKRDTTVWEEPTDTDYALESIFPATRFRERFARSDLYTSQPCTCRNSQPNIRPWTWRVFRGLQGVDTHVVRFLILFGDVCPLSQMVRDRLFSMGQSIIKKSSLIKQLLLTRGGENVLALMTAICIKPSTIPGDDVVSSNVGPTMTPFGKIKGRKISSRVCISLLKCLSSLAEALGIPTAVIPSQNQFERMAKVLRPAMHMLREGLYPYLSTSHRMEMYHWDANYGRLSKCFWIPPRRTLTEAIMALKLLAVEETTTSASYEGRHVLWISWYASEALGMRTYLWMNDVRGDDCGSNQGYVPLSRLRGISEPPGQAVFLRLQDSPHDSWKILNLFRGSEDLYIPDMLYSDDAKAFRELMSDRARRLNKQSSSLPTRPVWQHELECPESSASTRVDVERLTFPR